MDPLPSSPTDPQPDWARLRRREAFHEIILILRGALLPPVSDELADWARRDRAAMVAVAALQPVNAAEGRLAAQFVAAGDREGLGGGEPYCLGRAERGADDGRGAGPGPVRAPRPPSAIPGRCGRQDGNRGEGSRDGRDRVRQCVDI